MILEVKFFPLRSPNLEMQGLRLLPAVQHPGHCPPGPIPPEAHRAFMEAVATIGFHEV